MKVKVANENQMHKLGAAIASILKSGDIVYIFGELGAGKTTLTRGIACGFGYKGRVTSPSFALMNVYNTSPEIYHFDFYRLNSEDINELGLEDYLEKSGISIIEWPQNAGFYLPANGFFIYIDLIEEDYDLGRHVRIEAKGNEYKQRLGGVEFCVDSCR